MTGPRWSGPRLQTGGCGGSPEATARMAVTLTADQLRALLGGDDVVTAEEAARLLLVVSEVVNRYAPAAPDSLSDEAVIRTAGYMTGDDPTVKPLRRLALDDTVTLEPRAAGSVLRLSGAMSLLAPYRVRRAPGGAS